LVPASNEGIARVSFVYIVATGNRMCDYFEYAAGLCLKRIGLHCL